MQSIRQLSELREALKAMRNTGGRVALVPTMGALHAGHMALIAQAKTLAEHVVVSIFVNPTQFGPNEDLANYPRREAADSALLEAASVSVLWLPSVTEIYPPGFASTVSVAGLGGGLCGAARPGHFDGVATVVAKLLGQVRPDVAIFGEKDWQQLAIIRRMASDLNLDAQIVGAPIVRDPDGLALSSRNAYLSTDQRRTALSLSAALKHAAARIEGNLSISGALDEARSTILAAGFNSIDYVALVNADTLQPLEILDCPARILGAARIGKTRLIDNFPVNPKK